ncbi:GTP cyclohydrolase IIa [Halocatena halophila]|uniref:GTP cyclohydrolase IIa n=1 Tax=Halocatena halophila TaxID=2814576 RepID=UPI002ED1DC8E
MIQSTVFQLDDYGPWTVTPTPRAEMDLQTLQSRLYADVASFVGERGGYVFYTRGDNCIAITNGIDRETHRTLQRSIANRYPITCSMGIADGETPAAAVADATAALNAEGSAQGGTRTERLAGSTLETSATLSIAHFDIVDATGRLTDQADAYAVHMAVQEWATTLSRTLYQDHDALGFFVGGDNLIAVCPTLSEATYAELIDRVETETHTAFRVGVAAGTTPHEAGIEAKHQLELAREREETVVMAPNALRPSQSEFAPEH